MSDTPNPGSIEARAQGCTCAVIDNHYGRGVYFDGAYHWWRAPDCPLHGTQAAEADGACDERTP